MRDEIEHRRIRAEAKAALFGTAGASIRVGRFEIESRLGAGALGIVYAAKDPRLRRRVALKVLRRAEDELLSEAQALAKLTHPNVVTVFEAGVEDERVYIAMELVEGDTLRGWLSRRRDWRDVLAKMTDAGRGLAAAHDAGLVHCDFKPDNVFVAGDRTAVGDFGLAVPPGEASERHGGTPAYMAPEQHHGGSVGAAADQFAFCVALYEALYDAKPFPGSTVQEVARAKARGQLIEPPRGNDVPPWLWPVVRRGLLPEPRERWPNMEALLHALHTDPGATRWRRILIGAVAMIAFAAAVGATLQAIMFWDWMRRGT